jgi:uncharacterized protein (TIGR00303 family)
VIVLGRNFRGIITVRGGIGEELLYEESMCIYVIASTKTSTIPGISLAGQVPLLTLFTPALDVEYLYHGKPVSFSIIPTTPEGIPTPAIITRTALKLSNTPFIVVDAGSFVEPKIPTLKLSSRSVGGRIDIEDALPPGTSRRLFEEAKDIGRTLGSFVDVVVVGESMPGGTTTALAIVKALGFGDYNVVSSSSKHNPVDLKKNVVEKALNRLGFEKDPFKVNDVLGDPLHITIAGIALGVIEKGSTVVLAGGTQMLATLSLIKSIDPRFSGERVVLATTRWIYIDKGREILSILDKHFPNITFTYVDLNFSDAPYKGLRAYEEGFVKEGVGAGGTAFLALLRGVDVEDLKKGMYEEYRGIVGSGDTL